MAGDGPLKRFRCRRHRAGSLNITMKKMFLIAALVASGLVTNAQTNAPVASTVPPSDFFSGAASLLSSVYNTAQQVGLLDATNYAPFAYGTYASKAKDQWGGGGGIGFDFPGLSGTNASTGLLLGCDWLGSWSIVNANVTLKAHIHPLNIGILKSLPDSIRLLEVEPIVIGGVWTPMSGGGGGGTLWDLGGDIQFGHWLGGRFMAGATWGEWVGNTVEPGHRVHCFVGWRYGF